MEKPITTMTKNAILYVDLEERNMLVDGTLSFSITGLNDLNNYLISHEEDIALGINDFGCLRTIFTDIFNRDPSEYEHLV